MSILGSLKDVYYKNNDDDTLSIILITSNGLFLIENYEIVRLNEDFTLNDFIKYQYFNELNLYSQIDDVRIDYLEMDVRIELENNCFVTIFNKSGFGDDSLYQELNVFLSKDIDNDFLEIYREESESILGNIDDGSVV